METANVIAIPTIATRKSVPVLIVPPKKFALADRSVSLVREGPVNASHLVT